jgi:hypothetical protein
MQQRPDPVGTSKPPEIKSEPSDAMPPGCRRHPAFADLDELEAGLIVLGFPPTN